MENAFKNAVIDPQMLASFADDLRLLQDRIKDHDKGDILTLMHNDTWDAFTEWRNKFMHRNRVEFVNDTISYIGYFQQTNFYAVCFKDRNGAGRFFDEMKEIMGRAPEQDVHTALIEIGSKKRARKISPMPVAAIASP